MKLLCLSGSFRKNSYSLSLIQCIKDWVKAEEGFQSIEVLDHPIDQLPLYNQDLEADHPETVVAYQKAAREATAVLFVTPEYNHSIPAVLKNAIDWGSRPYGDAALQAKPVTILSQATGPVGGARVQAHLKLVLDSLLCKILPAHELMVADVHEVINERGECVNQDVKRRVLRQLSALSEFAQNVH
jgi:chromate reductase